MLPPACIRAKGDGERAIRDYSAAIDIGPKHASAFESPGFAYFSQGQIDKAIRSGVQ
jgi:hypothetical protein